MAKRRITVRKRQRFLEAVARGSSVSEAAEYAGVARSTVYEWQKDPDFAERVREAEEEPAKLLERKAFEMALGGNPRVLIWLLQRDERRRDAAAAAGPGAGVREIEIISPEANDGGDFITFVP